MKPSTHLFASMAAAALFASSARAAKIPDGMQWGVVLSFGNNQNNFQKNNFVLRAHLEHSHSQNR